MKSKHLNLQLGNAKCATRDANLPWVILYCKYLSSAHRTQVFLYQTFDGSTDTSLTSAKKISGAGKGCFAADFMELRPGISEVFGFRRGERRRATHLILGVYWSHGEACF